MNPKSTAILCGVAAALAAFLYFYELGGEQARQQAEDAQKRSFPNVEQTAVESISITATDRTSVTIERQDGDWQIVSPIDFAADRFAVDGIASALAQLTHETIIEKPSPKEVYGLDSELSEIRFTAGGIEYGLRTGDSTPTGGNVYVSIEGDSRVFTVAAYRAKSMRKSLDELRDRRVAGFDPTSVKRFVASWPGGRVVVERSGDDWKLAFPLEGSADTETVDGLLSSLSLLRAEAFVDAPAADLATGLEAPEFMIEIELSMMAAEAGEEVASAQTPKALQIAIGGLDDTATRRFVRAASPSYYLIPAASLDEFPRRLIEYRNRQLTQFSESAASRIELGFHSETGVSTVITAQRGAEGWTSSAGPIQQEKFAALVSHFSRLRGDAVVADALGKEELEGIGLNPPRVILSVFGEAGSEGEGGAEALLGVLHLGSTRAEGIFAQVPNRETVFALDAAIAEFIPVNLEAFQNHFAGLPEADTESDVELEPKDEGAATE
jgi:hypothetical protein